MANNRYITGDIAGINAPKKAPKVPMVQAVEPIKGDWSQNNNWGFVLDKRGGWPLVNPPSIFSIAQNPTFRGPPRGRGVVLAREDTLPSGAASPSINIQARVTLGIGGTSRQFLVDWGSITTLNLPSSNTTVEAVVTGANDNGFGNPVLGSYLQVFFSNEILPKDGFNTLTAYYTAASDVLIPPFVRGFMWRNVNLASGSRFDFYSTAQSTTPLARYDVDQLDTELPGNVYWLPTNVSRCGISLANPSEQYIISWVLSV